MFDVAKSSMLMMRQILWVGLAMGPGQQLLIQISNLHIFPLVSTNFKPVYYKKHARGQFLCILVSVFFALIKASFLQKCTVTLLKTRKPLRNIFFIRYFTYELY